MRHRRHTQLFLEHARRARPVYIDTEVDMTEVVRHRASSGGLSHVSYLILAAGRVLARHPDANAACTGRIVPRTLPFDAVHAKLAFDKTIGGRRAVVTAVIPNVDVADLARIQERVGHFRDLPFEDIPELAGVRALNRVPWLVGRALFAAAVRGRGRAQRLGTFAVTSLGHRPVDGFFAIGGTTVTLGAGQVRDTPVVRSGRVTVAPTMRLSLAFDHRVIDGALAADVLTEIKEALEVFDGSYALASPRRRR